MGLMDGIPNIYCCTVTSLSASARSLLVPHTLTFPYNPLIKHDPDFDIVFIAFYQNFWELR